MLSNGASIYEKYNELKYMTEDERQILLKDDNFMKKVIPDAMIVVVNQEEAYKFLQIKALDSDFLVTILPRDANKTILDKIELIEDLNDEIVNSYQKKEETE